MNASQTRRDLRQFAQRINFRSITILPGGLQFLRQSDDQFRETFKDLTDEQLSHAITVDAHNLFDINLAFYPKRERR